MQKISERCEVCAESAHVRVANAIVVVAAVVASEKAETSRRHSSCRSCSKPHIACVYMRECV